MSRLKTVPPTTQRSILDPSFRYSNAASTDVASTWERFGWVKPSLAMTRAKHILEKEDEAFRELDRKLTARNKLR